MKKYRLGRSCGKNVPVLGQPHSVEDLALLCSGDACEGRLKGASPLCRAAKTRRKATGWQSLQEIHWPGVRDTVTQCP